MTSWRFAVGNVVDIRTRKEITSGTPLPAHAQKSLGSAECPYCQAVVVIPPKLTASFTCRGGRHFHMFTKELLTTLLPPA